MYLSNCWVVTGQGARTQKKKNDFVVGVLLTPLNMYLWTLVCGHNRYRVRVNQTIDLCRSTPWSKGETCQFASVCWEGVPRHCSSTRPLSVVVIMVIFVLRQLSCVLTHTIMSRVGFLYLCKRAPFCIKYCTTLMCPLADAWCSAVKPSPPISLMIVEPCGLSKSLRHVLRRP